MKTLKIAVSLLAFVVLGVLSGCSATSAKSPDVSSSIRSSLNQAGFKDVTVSQDRDKGVVRRQMGKSRARPTSPRLNPLLSPSPDHRLLPIRLPWFPSAWKNKPRP